MKETINGQDITHFIFKSLKRNFKEFFSKNDKWLTSLYIIFLLLFFPITYSSGAKAINGLGFSYLFKQMVIVGISIFITFLFFKQSLSKTIFQTSWGFYIAGLVLVIYVFFGGVEINGARRWIKVIGGFTIQPSEILKIGIVVLGPLILSSTEEAFYQSYSIRFFKKLRLRLYFLVPIFKLIWKPFHWIFKVINSILSIFYIPEDSVFEQKKAIAYIVSVFLAMFCVAPSHFSMFAIYGFISLFTLGFLTRARRFFICYFLIIILGLGSTFLFLKYTPTQTLNNITKAHLLPKRVATWKSRLSPSKTYDLTQAEYEQLNAQQKKDLEFKASNNNLQSRRAKMAIVKGFRSVYQGPASSRARNDLPESENDFVFAFIIEEYGFLGLFLIPFLYLFFFYRAFIIGKGTKIKSLRGIAFCIGALFLSQAGINILTSVGLLPVTGQTLPLVSKGGTAFIMYSICFGILFAIAKNNIKENELNEIQKNIHEN